MDYYRVRAGHKAWTDKGPDLLRPPANAKQALRGIIADHDGLQTRFSKDRDAWTDWNRANKSKVLDRLTAWMHDRDGSFQVGVAGPGDKVEVVAVVKFERVPYIDLPHCSRSTSVDWSLTSYHFGKNVVLSGAFYYRQIAGSTDWSDHAWGTATDNSPKGISNDTLFDWKVRMYRERCMDCDYVLGSLKGEVKSASAPDFDIRPSGAAVSHTWHVHSSIVDHDGAKPARNPMFP